jgi:hypothetical protein
MAAHTRVGGWKEKAFFILSKAEEDKPAGDWLRIKRGRNFPPK